MPDESTMRDHIEDLIVEVAILQATIRSQHTAIEQWWLLCNQYRQAYEHARCLTGARCKHCEQFHVNSLKYAPDSYAR